MKPLLQENSVLGLRARIASWRAEGARVGLVPTMGALHEGHLTLVREAAKHADKIVVSIFVNPAQFAPHEDFDRYPRTLEADRAKLAAVPADLVYAPAATEMYPEGFATRIEIGGPSAGLETDFRPHFFAGVATVVAKLFLQCRPDIAAFGEKDYQQMLVVERLVKDLDLPIDILGVPVVRETDGLALSSRNAYLSDTQRRTAVHLSKVLQAVAARARSGFPVAECEAEGAAQLLGAGFERVDYVAIRDAETLQQVRDLARPARILGAAWLGKTRLIDNFPV